MLTSGSGRIKISNFVILLNIICVAIIMFLIYDLSKKRLFNQEFGGRLTSLYTTQKSYVNRNLGLCADDEQIIEFQLKEGENKKSKMKGRGFFYYSLEDTHNKISEKSNSTKDENDGIFDYSHGYKKNEVSLNLQEIKTFIESLGKFGQDKTIMNKFQADEIVNLSSLYYDHLFWSLFSEKETIQLKINKNKIFNLVLKNGNIQTKVITYISKSKNKNGKDELIVSFFDSSEFNKEKKNIEQFIITEGKNGKYKLIYNGETSTINKSSNNYNNIQLLFDFQNITTCFSLKVDYNND